MTKRDKIKIILVQNIDESHVGYEEAIDDILKLFKEKRGSKRRGMVDLFRGLKIGESRYFEFKDRVATANAFNADIDVKTEIVTVIEKNKKGDRIVKNLTKVTRISKKIIAQ